MDPLTIIGGIMTATGAGLGLGVGVRLLPIGLRARRDLRNWKASPDAAGHKRIAEVEERRQRLARPTGHKRDSSIAGIYEDTLRHTDGAYTRGYEAELAATMLAPDSFVEARYDKLARMLAVEKPTGTVIQFRFSSGPDPGRAIAAHLKARGNDALTHPEASLLHAINLDFYKTVAESRVYRHGKLSVWVRVPVRQAGDATSQGLSAFIPAAGRKIRRQGLSHLARAVRSSYAATRDDGIVRRIVEDEQAAREQAEKVFRLIERECPLALRRFD